MNPDDRAFDPGAIEGLRKMVGGETLDRICQLCREHTPGQVAAAKRGYEHGDFESARAALHSLEGSAAMLGGVGLVSLSRQIGAALRRQRGSEAAPLMARLEPAFEAFIDRLPGAGSTPKAP